MQVKDTKLGEPTVVQKKLLWFLLLCSPVEEKSLRIRSKSAAKSHTDEREVFDSSTESTGPLYHPRIRVPVIFLLD